ncbi:MAG: hypothetical protein ACI9LV_000019 [Candidatus Nanohaloarchaea archaeon]|jgi:hypothetical protein
MEAVAALIPPTDFLYKKLDQQRGKIYFIFITWFLMLSFQSAGAAPVCGEYTTYSSSNSYQSAYAESEIRLTDAYGKQCTQYRAVNYGEYYAQCTGSGDEFKLYIDKNPQGTEDCSSADFNCDENGCSNYDQMWTGNDEKEIRVQDTTGNIPEIEALCWVRDDDSGYWTWSAHTACKYNNDKVNELPNDPTNPSPNGASGVPRSPTLSVDVSDPENDDINVDFYDASDDSFISDTQAESGGTATVEFSQADSPSTTYSWYVEINDGNGVSKKSSTWSFTTEANNAPDNPSSVRPSGDNTVLSPYVGATYSDPDADEGTLYFETGSGSSIGSCDAVNGQFCTVTYSSADQPGENYDFQVYAEDDYGATSSTVSRSFTTTNVVSNSNSAAPKGSVWIENDEIHWADGSTERLLDNVNLVTSSSDGAQGSWWIENSAIHWIDQNGDERSFTAEDTGQNPGAAPGTVWIENDMIHYVDASGNERRVLKPGN